MTMVHAITEAAISTTSGITTDFTDFGFDIATPDSRGRKLIRDFAIPGMRHNAGVADIEALPRDVRLTPESEHRAHGRRQTQTRGQFRPSERMSSGTGPKLPCNNPLGLRRGFYEPLFT